MDFLGVAELVEAFLASRCLQLARIIVLSVLIAALLLPAPIPVIYVLTLLYVLIVLILLLGLDVFPIFLRAIALILVVFLSLAGHHSNVSLRPK